MIDCHDGNMVFVCDGDNCGVVAVGFHSAITVTKAYRELRIKGWDIITESTQPKLHLCPQCKRSANVIKQGGTLNGTTHSSMIK